jgi:MFS family permease
MVFNIPSMVGEFPYTYRVYRKTDIEWVGNIIANQGFINHLGFPNAQGVINLNANYTALWGAMQSLGQLVGMVLLNPISDRIGRKMTLYLLWIILACVSYRPFIFNAIYLWPNMFGRSIYD